MGPPRATAPRRKGIAMVLVLTAVAIATILSLGYITAQFLSVQISQNANARASARMIAESGLEMAVAYVRTDEEWRTERSEGTWVEDFPFSGGTFSITAQDGRDLDGDGTVDGDGDLADGEMDLLTLTAVGRYRNAVHTVRAVVPPVKRALMVVCNPSSPSSEDTDRYTLLRRWGWRVRWLGADADSAELAAALPDVQVIYFAAHTSLEAGVSNMLRELALPIVTEHKALAEGLKLSGGQSVVYQGSSVDVRELTRTITDELGVETVEVYKHYLTEPFAVGELIICSSPDDLLCLQGSAPGLRALAAKVGDAGLTTLAVLETAGVRAGGKPAPARRVALPWGDEDFAFAINSLNANGREILRRSLDWAGSGWKGPVPGIAVWSTISIQDMALVDGFDPAAGPYGGDNVNSEATLSTNAVLPDAVSIDGGMVRGRLYVSPDANASQVVQIQHGGAVTGGCGQLSLDVPIPAPAPPDAMPASTGSPVYSAGEHVIDQDSHFQKLTIDGNATVRISGNVRILCDKSVVIREEGKLMLDPNAALTWYTAGGVTVRQDGRVHVEAPLGGAPGPITTGDPARLRLIVLKGNVAIRDTAHVSASIQGFDSSLTVQNGAGFYGTFLGKSLAVSGSGAFHVDTTSSGKVGSLGGGYDLTKIDSVGLRWIERP